MVCITKQEAEIRCKRVRGIIRLMPKIDSATNIIKEALSHHSNPVVSFSGGKDSLIVLKMVRSIRPETIALFANTGNEYNETVPYIRSFSNVVELKPEKTFWQCVKEYGLPENKSKGKRHGNACCFWLKEKPLRKWQKEHNVDLVFTGLTVAESRQRMLTIKRMGYYYFNKQDHAFRCHPIHDWLDQDVWNYILFKGLRYNPIYDIGIPRCGCRFCTAYLTWREVTSLYNEKDTHILARKQGYKLLNDFNTQEGGVRFPGINTGISSALAPGRT